MPTEQPQLRPIVIFRTRATIPALPDLTLRQGTICVLLDPTEFVMLMLRVVAGVQQWVEFDGLGSFGWGRYVVSHDPALDTEFATINAAIAAFNATGFPDGAILIQPGFYAENITLPNGLSLAAMGGPGSVTIGGTVIVGAAGGGDNSMFGINVVGLLSFQGVGSQLLATDCRLTSTPGLDAILTSLTDQTSGLRLVDCAVATAGDVGPLALRESDPCMVTAQGTSFRTGAGLPCISSQQQLDLRDCTVIGRVLQAFGRLTAGADIRTTGIECIRLENGGKYEDTGGEVNRSDIGPWLTSDGSLGVLALLGDKRAGASDRIDGNTPNLPLRTIRPYQSEGVFGAGPFVITPDNPDVVVVLNGVAAAVINLDVVREFPQGQRRTFRRKLGDTGSITINPGAGDTIEGQAMLVIPVGPIDKSAGATLQADPDNHQWLVINMDAP